MQYRLFVYNERMKEYQEKGNYKTKKTAETKAKPHIDKKKDVKIIPIPTDELKIGMKIYKADGDLYGEIVDEGDSFWYIRRSSKGEDDKAMFVKSDFVEKYQNEVFIVKEDLDD